MALFRPYEQGKHEPIRQKPARSVATPASPSEPAGPQPDAGTAASAPRTAESKGRPTRSRAEAEAARMERLHPTLTPKQQRAQTRVADRIERQRRWEAVESTPERALLRDYVDARWTFTEFIIPLALVDMAVSIGGARWSTVSMITSFIMTAIFLGMVVNIAWMWWRFKGELRSRIPQARTRGLFMEMMNRMITIRRFRRPAPRIERGASY